MAEKPKLKLRSDPSGKKLKLQSSRLREEEKIPGAPVAGAMGASESILDSFMNIPRMLARGGGLTPIPRGAVQPEEPGGQLLPGLPSGAELAPMIDSILGGTVEENTERRSAIKEASPTATQLGGFGGDLAMLLTGRLPKAGPGGLLDKPVENVVNAFSKRLGKAGPGSTGFAAASKDIITSPAFQKVARGAGRSIETGLEGAALDVLQDGNPMETAGYAAGAQAISSGALTIGNAAIEWPFKAFGKKSPPKGLTKVLSGVLVNAMLGTALLNLGQNIVPGGDDSPLKAEEGAYEKLLLGMMLGLTVGTPGKRPKADGFMRRFPNMADAILTAPRLGMIKLAQQMGADPDVEKTVMAMAVAPDAFTPSQLKDFQDTVDDGGNLIELVSGWIEDPKFRSMLDVPMSQLLGVPEKQSDEDREREEQTLARKLQIPI